MEEHASCCMRFQFKTFYITLTAVKHRAVRQRAANSDSFYLFCGADLEQGRGRGERCGDVMSRLGRSVERAQQQSRSCACQPTALGLRFQRDLSLVSSIRHSQQVLLRLCWVWDAEGESRGSTSTARHCSGQQCGSGRRFEDKKPTWPMPSSSKNIVSMQRKSGPPVMLLKTFPQSSWLMTPRVRKFWLT